MPDYYSVITQPMDMGTMRKRLDEGFYPSMDAFVADFRLIVQNAHKYVFGLHHEIFVVTRAQVQPARLAHSQVCYGAQRDIRARNLQD